MSLIPVLYGYIQKLQNTEHSISHDLITLAVDTKRYNSTIPQENLVIILLTIVICWCCLGWVFDNLCLEIKQQNTSDNNGIDPEEFDYLSSSEAIPAKFNLIDAYVQMNDSESAIKVLTEIITQGNQQQRTKAIRILDEIG